MSTKKLLHDPNLLEKIDEKVLPGFYDILLYPFLQEIEKNYQIIQQEFDYVVASHDLLQEWPQKQMTDYKSDKWKVIPIYSRTNFYNQREKLFVYDNYFPKTLSLLHSVIGDDLCDVAFSQLSPKSRILPHYGYFSNALRCHLGLKIPAGDCGLIVNGQTKNWQEGKLLVFNEALEHTAWNETTQERIILMFDFIPDNYNDFFPAK
jgi:beta-hydroxylase